MNISICTFAKNRTEYVKILIPHLIPLLKEGDEIVFVDYDDQEKSGEWVRSLGNNKIKIIEIKNAPIWNMNHARNISVLNAKNNIILVIDIDVSINGNYLNECRNLKTNTYKMNPWQTTKEWWSAGTCCFWKKDFLLVNGYEEALVGWGFDDEIFYNMLDKNGIRKEMFTEVIKTIEKNPKLGNDENRQINKRIYELLARRNYKKSNDLRNWGRP